MEIVAAFRSATGTFSEDADLITIPVVLDVVSDRQIDFTVSYNDAGGCLQGTHFDFAGPAVVKVLKGQQYGLLQLTMLRTSANEANLTGVFTISTSDPNVTISGATFTLTRTNVASGPSVQFAVTDVEFEQATGSAAVKIALSAASSKGLTVDLVQTAGDLVLGTDITWPEQVTFGPTETTKEIIVSGLVGGSFGTATIALVNPTTGTIGTNDELIVTITEVASLPILRWKEGSRSAALVEGGPSVTLTAEVVGDVPTPFQPAVVAAPSSSATPDDYTTVPALGSQPGVLLSNSNREFSIEVSADTDALSDDGELLRLQLNGSGFAIFDQHRLSSITIGNTPPGIDPNIPAVRMAQSSINLVVGAPTQVRVVRDTGYPGEIVKVTLEGAPGSTAVEGVDYSLSSNEIILEEGDLDGFVTITALRTAPVSLALEIVANERISNTQGSGNIGSPSVTNLIFGSVNPSFSSSTVELTKESTSNELLVTVPSPLSVDYAVPLSVGTGNAQIVVPSSVTIPAGQTSAPVPITAVQDGVVSVQTGRYLDITVGTGGTRRATVIVNDVPVLEPPKLELIPGEATALVGRQVWMAISVRNKGIADFSGGPITVNLSVSGGNLSQSFDSQVVIDANTEIKTFYTVPSGSGTMTVTASSPYMMSGRDTCVVRNGQLVAGQTGQLRRAPVPNLNAQMVRFTMPLQTPQTLTGSFKVGNYEAHYEPIKWDHETGAPRQYLVTAMLPSGASGQSKPGIGSPLTFGPGSGFPASASLQEVDMSTMVLRLTATDDEAFEARPFTPGHASILLEETDRSGPFYRRTKTTVELKSTSNGDAILEAILIRETRCDMACELLTVVISNGRYDKTENPNAQASAGFGPVWFKSIVLTGTKGGGNDQNAIVAGERPNRPAQPGKNATEAQFYANNTIGEVMLTAQPTATDPDGVQKISSNSAFARRIAIYKPATVTQAQAQFVVERRDIGIPLGGAIGYHLGGFQGWMPMPDFSTLSHSTGGASDPWDAIELSAQQASVNVLGYLTESTVVDTPYRFAGWFKGVAPRDARQPGQDNMTLHGMGMPSPTGLLSRMIASDLMFERQSYLMIEASSHKQVTLDDIVHYHNGKLPTHFSVYYWPDEHRHPHMLDGAVVGIPGWSSQSQFLAASGKRWNTPAPGTVPLFEELTTHAGRGIYNQWCGSPVASHVSRSMSHFIGALEIMDDCVAELAMTALGVLSACSVTHLDVVSSEPSTTSGRVQSTSGRDTQLKPIVELNRLDAFSRRKGVWRKPDDYQGSATYTDTASTRQYVHPVAATMFMLQLFPPTDPRAEIYDVSPNGAAWSYPKLVAQVHGHQMAGNGNGFSTYDLSLDRFDGNLQDYETTEGAIPGRAANGYSGYTATPGYYGAMDGIHEAYWPWAFVQIEARMRRTNPGLYQHQLHLFFKRASICEDAILAVQGASRTPFNVKSHTTVGMKGRSNRGMTEGEARAGLGYWKGQEFLIYSIGPIIAANWWYFRRADNLKAFVERQTQDLVESRSIDDVIESFWSQLKNFSYRYQAQQSDYGQQGLAAIAVLQRIKELS